jgi:cytochrome c oxidase subunit 2
MAHDVLHSFWVPAFRVKIDAVPGMFTKVTATPNELGSFDDDVNFRIQCAELCGVGHATMQLPVRVVERAEFDQWLTEQKPIAARR